MFELSLVRDHYPAAPTNRRHEVLAVLRASRAALSADDVAREAGLHLNTARVHLDALVKAGLAERTSEPRKGPGRPRLLYSAHGPLPGQRAFPLLAEMLTGLVSRLDDGATLATEAGREWGRHLLEGPPPSRHIDAADATEELHELMDRLGFRPEQLPAEEATDFEVEMMLRNCPFREVAEEHTAVVCGLHLGIMQGALQQLRAPVEVTSLDPFVTPHTCAAQLRPTAERTHAPRSR